MHSRAFSRLPIIGLLTLVYFIAGKFGLMLASLHASASPVWPPAGIALAALLVLGYRAWPAIFVGGFLVNVSTAGNVATSLAAASGNTLEAMCGAWLVNRFAGGTTVFDRPQGVFKFALAALVSTIISPAFGVTSLALAGFADWANYRAIWLTWWLGDTTSDLLIAPLIILWSIASKRRWNRREAVEVGILLLLLFVLSEAVFGGWLTISARDYPIAFICGAIVIWTAFRFTQRETATGIFILSAIAIWGTLHGFGPFAEETENQSLLALQYWTAVVTITAMALSAGMAEHGRGEEALRESEARTNLAANAANLGLWFWNMRDDKLWVTKQWRRLFGFAESEPVSFDRVLQVVHPDDRERTKQLVQQMFEGSGGEYENEYQIGDTIRELLRIVHADAIGREIEVKAEVDSDAGQVWGDPVQILQVLLNLAINSFEAMTAVPSDARRLAIHAGRDGNGDILVSVRDSGPGFPSGKVEQLFKAFFSTKAEGTGMGLAISRSIIKAHGGTLSGENCDGGGACFTVRLPQGKEDNSQAA